MLDCSWDSAATGMLIGLSGFTTKSHICRATIEAVCFQTRAILEAMAKDCGLRLNHVTTNTSSPVHTPAPHPLIYGDHLTAIEATKVLVAGVAHALEEERHPTKVNFVQINAGEEILKVDGGMTASDIT